MTDERILELLAIEKECVLRNFNNTCDRDCRKCDLVQEDWELLAMYDALISAYEIKCK